MDPVTRAFPDPALADAAHAVVGEALAALLDAEVELDAARRIVREGIEAVIQEYEGG